MELNPLPNELADEWMHLVDRAKDLFERSLTCGDGDPPPLLLDRIKRVRNTFDIYLARHDK